MFKKSPMQMRPEAEAKKNPPQADDMPCATATFATFKLHRTMLVSANIGNIRGPSTGSGEA